MDITVGEVEHVELGKVEDGIGEGARVKFVVVTEAQELEGGEFRERGTGEQPRECVVREVQDLEIG